MNVLDFVCAHQIIDYFVHVVKRLIVENNSMGLFFLLPI